MRDYKLISADSHINEPPDLWRERVPVKFRDRAPRMEHFERGDAWVMEGAVDEINFGANCCAGIPSEQRSPWIKWEEVRAGGYDPKARLGEQDDDGVDAELMYPTPRVGNQVFWHVSDPDFHLACIRAYNDWLAEYCSYDTERLWGVALMPNIGTAVAMEEFERTMALPGMRAVMLGQYPHGGEQMSAEDDAFWGVVEAAGVPISIHVAFATAAQGDTSKMKLTGSTRFYDAPVRIQQFIDTGVFDRYPKLQVVFVEVDSSWTPYLSTQMDDRYLRTASALRAPIKRLPSEYFADNILTTFITDPYAIPNRHTIGISQMMWSSDYPHTGSDWPDSWTTIDKYMEGVPEEEKHALLAGNALRLYGRS